MRFEKLRYYVGLFLLTSLLGACKKEEVRLTIEEDRFVAILLDSYLAEGALQPVYSNHKDSLSNQYYEQIFKIHDITRKDFLDNIKILRENPEYGREVYKKVLTKHTELNDKLKKK